ncbi:hypothetical protein [Azomonas macrocytogenes]|uniref:Uncharacterized protein n=1 Tax=Azomonas macrocytogenes TaxID=69962 RepID=A0A839T652_AZOMA|nr:hypothetical protein [Azomonas macrocytogenes]MBB3103774.1 hypothetical protein [Azomonas macrocytogenes]
MIYRDVLSAVVRCLAAECIDNTSKQAWQKQYQSGYPVSRENSVSADDMMAIDCWVFARLHSQLKSRSWYALVAKYSTHKARKVEAIGRLIMIVESPAPQLFRYKAVTAWAIPPLKGKDGKRSTDMIVLPSEFYDMNTWDLEAHPERTRRRWRADVYQALEAMVNDALVEAQEILQAEGLLVEQAA